MWYVLRLLIVGDDQINATAASLCLMNREWSEFGGGNGSIAWQE